MALGANRELKFYASQELIELPVKDNVNIYKGAWVGRDRATGYARPLVAGDDLLGVAYKQADNTVAGHTAGGVLVRLHQNVDVIHALTGVATADIGKGVYASDDETLTLTPTGNTRVGRIVAVEAANTARVRVETVFAQSGIAEGYAIASLADADATLTLDHVNRVLLIANTAARTLTLPAAATVRAGGWIRVVKTTNDLFAVTLDANGSETIDGATTLATIDAQYDVAHLVCTGSEWIVLSRDIA